MTTLLVHLLGRGSSVITADVILLRGRLGDVISTDVTSLRHSDKQFVIMAGLTRKCPHIWWLVGWRLLFRQSFQDFL